MGHSEMDWGVFWAAVAAVAALLTVIITGGLVALAWGQLRDFNKTSRFDFYHKVTSDFFTQDARELITLLVYEALVFEKGEKIEVKEWEEPDYCPYFKIRKDILAKVNKDFKLINKDREIYTLFEIEDMLLNPIEDLWFLKSNGVLDLSQITYGFETYIDIVIGSKEIRKHIEYLSEEDAYVGCLNLYNEFDKINKAKDGADSESRSFFKRPIFTFWKSNQ
jgi:hypothetical protein